MNAYLKKTFPKGFFLTEENIIKLKDIITRRLEDKGITEPLTFKTYRVDSLVYESPTYDNILQEENSKRNFITKLEFNFKNTVLILKLAFEKDENTLLNIEATDKDFAYLLFSDIKDYLNTEILRFRAFKFSSSYLQRLYVPIVLLAIIIIFPFAVPKPKLSDADFQQLLNNGSIESKINYLLQVSHANSNIARFQIFMLAVIVIAFMSLTFGNLLDLAYPRNIFYLGKEINRYDRHCSIRSKIMWGVIVAFVIGVASSLFVYKFTAK